MFFAACRSARERRESAGQKDDLDGAFPKEQGVEAMSEKKTYEHIIREKWCKGCNICVAYCPKKVLSLRNGKVTAERPHDCIGCRLCELRCPDYAIEIREVGAQPADSEESVVDYSVPPEVANV